ncbi:MAG TPA: hypothetical protein VHS99_19045 [Chloroflexota bacterium]|jgi:hypothetical protein|nr:hypothetical protein [Chloroflexota bacterium]
MPRKVKPDSKLFPEKHTLNPPGGKKTPPQEVREERRRPREVGQFTGPGQPARMKK